MMKRSLIKLIKESKRFSSVSSTAAISEKDVKFEEQTEKFPGWNEALPYEKIPRDFSLPFVGSIWQFLPGIGKLYGEDLQGIYNHLHAKYGKIAALDILGYQYVILFDPKDVETMYRTEGVWPYRKPFKAFEYYRRQVRKDIFKDSLGAISNGKEWYDYRSAMNPVFMHARLIKQYIKGMNDAASDLVNAMAYYAENDENSEMPADFQNEINKWALDSISSVAFDTKIGAMKPNLNPDSDAQRLITNIGLSNALNLKLEFPTSLWQAFKIPTPDFKKFIKAMDVTTELTNKYVMEGYERIKNLDPSRPQEEMSILEKLLRINVGVALATITDTLIDGIDSTSRTTASMLYLLARHPEKQEELRRELLKVLPSPDTPVTEEVLRSTPLLKAVFKETSRLIPLVPGSVRVTTKDIALQGYKIPKGTELLADHMLLSLDDRYVHRAKEFLPERWLRSTKGPLSYKNINPFVSLPFGFGPRMCMGIRIASFETESVIAKVVRNFELSWPHEDMKFRMDSFYGVTNPFKIRLKLTPSLWKYTKRSTPTFIELLTHGRNY